MTKTHHKPVEVLLVEDNPADSRLIVEAFKEGEALINLHVVSDGVEAMAFVRREDGYLDAPRPDLILLDLNLPRKNGYEVLAEIKADHALRRIPIVVLTTSHIQADATRAYDLHANCFLTKPIDLNQFFVLARCIEELWLSSRNPRLA